MLADHIVHEDVQRGGQSVIVPQFGVSQRLTGATLVPLPHGQEEPFNVAHGGSPQIGIAGDCLPLHSN
jgi:hypothetical protein